MSEALKFREEVRGNVAAMSQDAALADLSKDWIQQSLTHKYPYSFTWLGRPVIQFPQDMVAMQEIIWSTKPDLIIETGIAHGGSLIFHASMLALNGGDGQVLGIDIDIREHNRVEIESHPMFSRITMFEGSSIEQLMIERVTKFAAGKRVMVVLDSNHTHDHVLRELEIYSSLITKDCYLVVMDTIIEDMPAGFYDDRPWDIGNNPKTAVWEFLKHSDRFVIDRDIQSKLLITGAPDGYLLCVK